MTRPWPLNLKSPTAAALGVRFLIATIAFVAIGTFAYYAGALLLKYPPIWPDEALTVRRHGSSHRFGSTEVGFADHSRFLCHSLVVWFAQGNLSRLSRINLVQNGPDSGRKDHVAWCERIDRAIPRGSSVLLSVIPDPYFGLRDRPDLVLREFVPEGTPVNQNEYWRYMASADYIDVGCEPPSAMVDRFVQSRGQLIAELGAPPGKGYCGRIYKVGK